MQQVAMPSGTTQLLEGLVHLGAITTKFQQMAVHRFDSSCAEWKKISLLGCVCPCAWGGGGCQVTEGEGVVPRTGCYRCLLVGGKEHRVLHPEKHWLCGSWGQTVALVCPVPLETQSAQEP